MRRSRFSDDEILVLVEEADRGIPIDRICEAAHVSVRTFYRWRRRLAGVKPAGLQHLNSLEAENRRLKRQLALAGSQKQTGPLKPHAAWRRNPSRSECGMDPARAQNATSNRPPETAASNLPSRAGVKPVGAGALMGRFAHVRSGSSRR